MGLTIVEEGETLYVTGDTYSHRAALRAIGARWDAARKQWCVGREKRDAVEAIVARAATPPAEQAPGLDAIVAGRASYKGRTYYVAGRVERGRTRYDDSVRPVVTRDGGKVLLYSRDGSLQFWAPLAQVVGSRIKVGEPIEMTDGAQILTTYSRPMTIASLREYAEQARSYGTDDCRCRCHREPNAGAPGSTLYDGCERCGCEE